MPSVFPAHAGMIPRPRHDPHQHAGVPRTRGDDPRDDVVILRRRDVFPAHAGMIPNGIWGVWRTPGVPRTRGDDPKRCRTSFAA